MFDQSPSHALMRNVGSVQLERVTQIPQKHGSEIYLCTTLIKHVLGISSHLAQLRTVFNRNEASLKLCSRNKLCCIILYL